MKRGTGQNFFLICFLSVLLFVFIGGCVTQKKDSDITHLVSPGDTVFIPVTQTESWKRVIQAADSYRQYAPISRIGFSDITRPASIEEYHQLDGYGLLLITIITQNEQEIPVKRAFFRGENKMVEFEKLYEQTSRVPDEYDNVIKVLGKYRADTLYLFPLYCRVLTGDLIIDFMKNRDGFVVTKFPIEKDDLPVTVPSSKTPPMNAIDELIKREVPLFEHFIQ